MKWEIHSEQDRRIYEVLKDIEEDNYMVGLEKWEEILKEKLIFPFEAIVEDSDDGCPMQVGDRLKVHGIGMIDDLHGIIVDVRKGRRKYAFELCLIEVLGDNEEMKQLVDDYSVWFWNR
ncbi:calcium-binding protein [Marinisporobacter balticus]|uniref:Calcium binding protein n=1 Tax=Marinisporobacter balticus TaxID=2018667 RepID=A0A4R2KKI2_9FIRM|nr:calcium-binding protein [Marinisporobacter balticus]TCO73844.1 calcium binding protein [Marinisporobacter balticus]